MVQIKMLSNEKNMLVRILENYENYLVRDTKESKNYIKLEQQRVNIIKARINGKEPRYEIERAFEMDFK